MRNLTDFQEQWAVLVDRYFGKGINSLSPNERIWFCGQSLVQAIFDGGLISYYFNSGANDMDECLRSLEVLQEHRLASLIRAVNTKLFPGGVPEDIDDRNRLINSWPDDSELDHFLDPIEQEAESIAEALDRKLVAFIERHELAPKQ